VARPRLSSTIQTLETSRLHWSYWAATFVAFVVLRNLLESAFGPERVIGFAHRAPLSALMVFDHFLLFYVSVFLSLAIILSMFSGERIGRVMRVMTPAWALVLIPPPTDFLLSGGEGTHISYVLTLSGVLGQFFDPRIVLDRISFGQRIEVIAACVLGLLYVRIKTRSWWRGVASFALIYLAIAAHGMLPSAFARLSKLVADGAVGLPAAAYDAVFSSGGIVLEESRKLALLFLLTSTVLGWAVVLRHAPGKARAALRNLRPLRALHYVGMTGFGIALGWAALAPAGFSFSSGGDVLGIAGLLLATFLAFEASVGLNDLFDVTTDSLSEPDRPLVTGELTEREAVVQFVVLGGLSLLAALNVSYASFLFLAMALLVSLLYSAKPVRLKRLPVAGTLTLGLLSLLSALVGFAALMGARTLLVFPARIGWLLVLAFGLAFSVKDLKDVEGDRADGTLTLPILLGPVGGRRATAALAAAGYLVVPLILPYRALGWTAIGLALVNAVAVLRLPARRVVRPLLVLYLVFALAAAIVIVSDIDSVLDERSLAAAADQSAALAGRSHLAAGRVRQAAMAYHTVDEPGIDQDGLVRAGVALLRAGDPASAVPKLEAAVGREPTSIVATEHLVAARRELGQPVRAAHTAHAAVRRGLRPDVFLGHLAELALDAGRPGEAVEFLSAALRSGRPEVDTRIRLGDAMAAAGRTDASLRQYALAARRHPRSADARDAYGRALHAAGRPLAAVKELEAALSLDPSSALLWNNLAVVAIELEQYDDALAALARACELAPRLPDAYYNRGRVYERLGRPAEARRQYLLALEVDPAFTPARTALSRR